MVYAAHTRALAALESLAQFGGAERRMAFMTFEIDIPDKLAIHVAASALPRGWRRDEPAAATQGLGSEWQLSRRSAALAVPSVLGPQDFLVLLNPDHPDIVKGIVSSLQPF